LILGLVLVVIIVEAAVQRQDAAQAQQADDFVHGQLLDFIDWITGLASRVGRASCQEYHRRTRHTDIEVL
jgi:hypothetical protein